MSYETAQARLDAATEPTTWKGVYRDNGAIIADDLHGDRGDMFVICRVVSGNNVPFIAHAPTDLAAALEVVKRASAVLDYAFAHSVAGPELPSLLSDLLSARDDFEALP